MRSFLLILVVVVFPSVAWAIEAPSSQVYIDADKVLRGRFVEEHQMMGAQRPVNSSGHFVVAPSRGLIWSIETPFPTSTIVTPKGAVQDVGGIAIKLPMKNLQRLYEVIGRALAGDWNGLETDFVITSSGNAANHWQLLLTPRSGNKPMLPYAKIMISGSRFVENIVMTKAAGKQNTLSFSDEVMSSTPLTDGEIAVFSKVRQ